MAGVVPYTLRFPTPEGIWRSVWDPGNPHLLVPRSFGVGWRLNLAEVEARLERLFRRLMRTREPAGAARSGAASGTASGRASGTRGGQGSRSRQSASRSRTNSSARP